MAVKLTIDSIRKEFEAKSFVLLTKEYKNSRQKFRFICTCGNEAEIRLDHMREGVKCAACAGNKKLTLDYVRDALISEGYILLSNKYMNSKSKFKYKCPKGHIGSINWNNWSTGVRCSECFGTHKYDIEEVKNHIESEGYYLTNTVYYNEKQKLTLICPNDHVYEVSWDNWKTKNSRCPQCNKVGISKAEKELQQFLTNSLELSIKINDRGLISPYELDIVIPDKKIAIEYCGLYWHSELNGKDKNYHKNKLNMCNDIGYKLITIFEDEWISKSDIVKDRLSNLLNNREVLSKIYARNCIVDTISFTTAKSFCEENHLQGFALDSVRLGLFYEGMLVSVMTFAKPSLSKGHKASVDNVFELSRFCSLKGFRVLGAASKLLKYFEKNYICDVLFSYADRRWSGGDLYTTIGFDFVGITKPNYWYFKNNKKRIHRFSLRKTKEDSKVLTEWEIRKTQKWNRIWDCGNLKFSKIYNK